MTTIIIFLALNILWSKYIHVSNVLNSGRVGRIYCGSIDSQKKKNLFFLTNPILNVSHV